MLYPKFLYQTLSSDSNNTEVSPEEINRKMHAFRIAKMIGEYWSSRDVARSKNISHDIEKMIDPNYWYDSNKDIDPLPLTWNQISFSKSFTIGFN